MKKEIIKTGRKPISATEPSETYSQKMPISLKQALKKVDKTKIIKLLTRLAVREGFLKL